MIDAIKKPEISVDDIFRMACAYAVQYNEEVEYEIGLVEGRGGIWGGYNRRTVVLEEEFRTRMKTLNDMMPKDEDGEYGFRLKWLYDDNDICMNIKLMYGTTGTIVVAMFNYVK